MHPLHWQVTTCFNSIYVEESCFCPKIYSPTGREQESCGQGVSWQSVSYPEICAVVESQPPCWPLDELPAALSYSLPGPCVCAFPSCPWAPGFLHCPSWAVASALPNSPLPTLRGPQSLPCSSLPPPPQLTCGELRDLLSRLPSCYLHVCVHMYIWRPLPDCPPPTARIPVCKGKPTIPAFFYFKGEYLRFSL